MDKIFENLAEKPDKQTLWSEKLEGVKQWQDRVGNKIDENMYEVLAALNLSGLPTQFSCGGHLKKLASPWVQLLKFEAPVETFIDESKTIELIAKKYNFDLEKYKNGKSKNRQEEHLIYRLIEKEAYKIYSKNEKTPERKQREKEIKDLDNKVNILLDEFYKGRNVPKEIKLKVFHGQINFDIADITEVEATWPEPDFSQEEKNKLRQIIPERQKEIEDFGRFLKRKYFED